MCRRRRWPRYPLKSTRTTLAWPYAAAVTDGVFACPIDAMASDLARRAPVYAYEFADRHAPAPEPMRQVPFSVGASHALELRYLFDIGGAPPLNPAQRELSAQMIGYWAQFVTTVIPTSPASHIGPRRKPITPAVVATTRRCGGRHGLRRASPVRVLGRAQVTGRCSLWPRGSVAGALRWCAMPRSFG